jgi:hypothetical protein
VNAHSIAFVLFVCSAVAVTFIGHRDFVNSYEIDARRSAKPAAVLFLVIAGGFWLTLHDEHEFWALAAFLAEITGAALLALEVAHGHDAETKNSPAFVALDEILAFENPTDEDTAENWYRKARAKISASRAQLNVLDDDAFFQLAIDRQLGDVTPSWLAWVADFKRQIAEKRPTYMENAAKARTDLLQARKSLLHFGLFLIIAGLTGHGLLAMGEPTEQDTRQSVDETEKPAQVARGELFLAGNPILFFPAEAAPEVDGRRKSLDTAVCRVKDQLAAYHSTTALVFGRHDRTAMGPAARLKFTDNAGLARQRAEFVAEELRRKTDGCESPAILDVTTLFGYPSDVEATAADRAKDRAVTVYGARNSK